MSDLGAPETWAERYSATEYETRTIGARSEFGWEPLSPDEELRIEIRAEAERAYWRRRHELARNAPTESDPG